MAFDFSVTKDLITDKKAMPSFVNYANKCRKKNLFNDVTVKAGDKEVSANQLVLSCYCTFFEKLFKTSVKKKFVDPIELEGVSERVLELLINYIYTGRIYLTSKTVMDLLAGAHYLLLDEVKEFCFLFLENNTSLSNCILNFKAAVRYDNRNLKRKISQIISKDFDETCQSKEFQELTFKELSSLLYNLDRDSVDKMLLRKSITDWVKYDEESRTKKLVLLMWFVDVKELTLQFLKSVLSEKYLAEHPDCSSFITRELPLLVDRIETMGKETRIISIGGGSTPNQIIELINIDGSNESCSSTLPVSLHSHASLHFENAIFCIGGYSSEKPSSSVWKGSLVGEKRVWQEFSPLSFAKVNMGATVFNKFLAISGGENFCQFAGIYSREIAFGSYIHDNELNKWMGIYPAICPRYGHEMVSCAECLYSVGGRSMLNIVLGSMERLQTVSGRWESVKPMLSPRTFFAAVSYQNFIYVFGGEVSHCKVLKSVEKYDPAKNEWVKVSDMMFERRHHRACVMQGKIYIVGGYNADFHAVKEIECYYPFIDRFEVVGSTKYDLYDHSLIAL